MCESGAIVAQGYQVTNEHAFLKSGLYQGYCIETEASLLINYKLLFITPVMSFLILYLLILFHIRVFVLM